LPFISDHVSLVTGASTGIGAATAMLLAQRGSRVAVHFNKNESAAKRVVDQILQNGGKAFALQADLTDPAAPSALVEQVLAQFGRIDLLVNNAGSLFERRPLLQITDDYWARIFALNVDSVLRLVRFVAPGMIERGSGCIVNISSIAGRNGGGPGALAYATAKGAVLTMTKGLAKELIAHGIRVNAVNPGVIDTPFHEQFTSEQQMKTMVANIPQKRAGTSEETATVIAFLASDDASHIVGEAIEVNGGLLMD
jgi:NAD(P)-dependent dehydrogenase (short-subunit alcohol dehydrogenase family)